MDTASSQPVDLVLPLPVAQEPTRTAVALDAAGLQAAQSVIVVPLHKQRRYLTKFNLTCLAMTAFMAIAKPSFEPCGVKWRDKDSQRLTRAFDYKVKFTVPFFSLLY